MHALQTLLHRFADRLYACGIKFASAVRPSQNKLSDMIIAVGVQVSITLAVYLPALCATGSTKVANFTELVIV